MIHLDTFINQRCRPTLWNTYTPCNTWYHRQVAEVPFNYYTVLTIPTEMIINHLNIATENLLLKIIKAMLMVDSCKAPEINTIEFNDQCATLFQKHLNQLYLEHSTSIWMNLGMVKNAQTDYTLENSVIKFMTTQTILVSYVYMEIFQATGRSSRTTI